jgi:hypothetical protein
MYHDHTRWCCPCQSSWFVPVCHHRRATPNRSHDSNTRSCLHGNVNTSEEDVEVRRDGGCLVLAADDEFSTLSAIVGERSSSGSTPTSESRLALGEVTGKASRVESSIVRACLVHGVAAGIGLGKGKGNDGQPS